MRKVFIFLISVFAFVCVKAQTNQNLYLQNSNGRLFRYGYQAFLTTSDDTARVIATFPIADDEAGLLQARVVGIDTAASDVVTGVIGIRYKKVAGTLTLGSPISVQAVVTDAGVSGSTFAWAASSNNVVLRVTGDTSSIVWRADVMWTNLKKDNILNGLP